MDDQSFIIRGHQLLRYSHFNETYHRYSRPLLLQNYKLTKTYYIGHNPYQKRSDMSHTSGLYIYYIQTGYREHYYNTNWAIYMAWPNTIFITNNIIWMVTRALIPWNFSSLLSSRDPYKEYYKGLTLPLWSTTTYCCGSSEPQHHHSLGWCLVAGRASLLQDAIPWECRSLSLDSLKIDIQCFLSWPITNSTRFSSPSGENRIRGRVHVGSCRGQPGENKVKPAPRHMRVFIF
jgi:hypothetical protein